jgi:omega-6 fatty acid desaturase (delta-12 desaturase)
VHTSRQIRDRLSLYNSIVAPRSELYALVESFVRPRWPRAVAELLETFIPYVVLNVVMVLMVGHGHPILALALTVPAAAFLVRVFIIFHDCCHGSFFRSRRANRITGYVAGILTLTPYDKWQREHAAHHATAGDLDRRGIGDVWTLTTTEYLTATKGRRLFYRAFRNPFIMFGLGPSLLFLIANRFSGSGHSSRERFSVYVTNTGIVAAFLLAYLTIGLSTLLLIQLPTLLLAGASGVWLFYVQHQFDDVYWARHEAWVPMKAALEGSSYYQLPKVLQWLTGSIGLHHIHHVQPRIPFYNLQRCQDAIPAFQAVRPLTVRHSLHSLRLRLLDETGRRMVTLAALKTRGHQLPKRGQNLPTFRHL